MNVSIEKEKLEARNAISRMSRAVSPEKISLGKRAKEKSKELMKRMDEIVIEATKAH